jgi:glycosyltransferase involved in cell wall biosynthesis
VKLLVLWTAVAPYLTAQLRELGAHGIDVHLVTRPARASGTNSFGSQVLDGLRTTLLTEEAIRSDDHLWAAIEATPDAILVSGWSNPAFSRLLLSGSMADATVLMAMDTRYESGIRQRLNRLRNVRVLRRIDHVVVPGRSAARSARALGFPPSCISRGLFAVDGAALGAAARPRLSGERFWPRRFLYVGRLTERKGVDTLLDAYRRYRASTDAEPWTLDLCGQGPLLAMAMERDGVNVHGFVQPEELPDHFGRAGAFVLASRIEPWGLVVAEAAAAGLPLIVTEQVGAAPDLVEPGRNGVVVPSSDAGALARALQQVAGAAEDDLRRQGHASAGAAAAFDLADWPDRFLEVLRTAKQGAGSRRSGKR